MLALSLTLVAGTAGQISFGQAGLLAIGGYASALLAIDLGAPAIAFDPRRRDSSRARSARCSSFRPSACAGITSRSRRLAIGEIVSLVILNWESLTRRRDGH